MIAQSTLVSVFNAPGQTLPIKTIGVLRRTGSHFCAGHAGPPTERLRSPWLPRPTRTILLTSCARIPPRCRPATIHWDLSQPAIVSRAWVVLFDPISSLQAVSAKSGTNALIKYVSIPPAPLGLFNVKVTTNLPPNRQGLSVLGANLECPAAPPFRPTSIEKQVVFTEPDDTAAVELQLSIREQLILSVAGYAVFTEAGSVRQDVAPARSWTATGCRCGRLTFLSASSISR